jgi:hypothetical protein
MPRRLGAQESDPVALFWDQSAERAALGAALVNHPAAVYVAENLPLEDLYRERDRRYLGGIVDLLIAGREVDPVTLAAHLGAGADEKLELHGFAASVPSTSNVAEYVAVVRSMARHRRQYREARTALEELVQGNGQGEMLFRKRLAEMLDREADESSAACRTPLLDWSTFWEVESNDAEWAYPDVLARGRGHAIYAAHKTGKSLLALFMAAALATGPESLVVVYLDYEMSEADLRERLVDMGYGSASDLSRLRYALLPSMPPLDTAEGALVLTGLLDRVQADWPDHHLVVVIDTIGRAVSGEENSADTFRAFYQHTGMELKRRGCTWLRLDHAGKESSQGQRGSSAKGDDVDLVWKLTQTENGVQLQRELARMSWVPEQITFKINTSPLDFVRLASDWPAGTDEVAYWLDKYDVALGATCSAAMAVLREHDVPKRKQLVLAALRYRRERQEGTS